MNDNLPAADVTFAQAALAEIDQAFAAIDVQGAPLSAALDAEIDRSGEPNL